MVLIQVFSHLVDLCHSKPNLFDTFLPVSLVQLRTPDPDHMKAYVMCNRITFTTQPKPRN